jgi:hypothetical protein
VPGAMRARRAQRADPCSNHGALPGPRRSAAGDLDELLRELEDSWGHWTMHEIGPAV